MDKKVEIGGGPLSTTLAKDTKVNGTLKVDSGIRIDGEFEGQLETNGTLVVGKGGLVKAEIKARDAIIGGKVVGNITASSKVELQSGSVMMGDIKSKGLIIDNEVFFEGMSKMSGQKRTRKVKFLLTFNAFFKRQLATPLLTKKPELVKAPVFHARLSMSGCYIRNGSNTGRIFLC